MTGQISTDLEAACDMIAQLSLALIYLLEAVLESQIWMRLDPQ
jgi:hypothetical protein